MKILGIGADLIETARLARIIARQGESFLRRCFTDGEIGYCQAHAAPELPFAARFAAKEAIAKAFGTGIGERMNWTDLEIAKLPSGQPVVTLHGAAREFADSLRVVEIKVSLTHTENYAAAYAMVICEA
jgi:holo-[acyl-carrier protein] synthase